MPKVFANRTGTKIVGNIYFEDQHYKRGKGKQLFIYANIWTTGPTFFVPLLHIPFFRKDVFRKKFELLTFSSGIYCTKESLLKVRYTGTKILREDGIIIFRPFYQRRSKNHSTSSVGFLLFHQFLPIDLYCVSVEGDF